MSFEFKECNEISIMVLSIYDAYGRPIEISYEKKYRMYRFILSIVNKY